MNKTLSQLIRSTKEYSDVCDTCKDEILIYPTISGRTEYTQEEVEQITLKRIIDKLRAKEQECETLKGENFTFVDLIKTQEELIDKYKQALDEVEKIISTPCIPTIKTCVECKCSSCLCKQVLNIINKAKEA